MRDALIVIDGAEKKPLGPFPDVVEVWTPGGVKQRVQIHTETRRISTGDYILASHPGAGGVERKNGPHELHENLFTQDSDRFGHCLDRLAAEFASPALYIEATIAELDRPLALPRPTRHEFPGGRILDRLLFELAARRIVLLTGAGATIHGKRKGAELVARYLIQAAYAQEK
jgi:hypothetical protein